MDPKQLRLDDGHVSPVWAGHLGASRWRRVFCSRWNSRIKCSTDLLTLASESIGSHQPVVEGSYLRQPEDPVGDKGRRIIWICTVTVFTNLY